MLRVSLEHIANQHQQRHRYADEQDRGEDQLQFFPIARRDVLPDICHTLVSHPLHAFIMTKGSLLDRHRRPARRRGALTGGVTRYRNGKRASDLTDDGVRIYAPGGGEQVLPLWSYLDPLVRSASGR